jgi:5-methylcytosine-specific restriction endonuclease McrA
VFERDVSRCQVPLASGGICGSTYRVQLGHLTPRARGGLPTEENLRCECAVHNQRQADRDYGEAFMARFRRKRARAG